MAVLDLVAKAPVAKVYERIMNASFSSIMPQVVAVWCEEAGHDVTFVCYTGAEDLEAELPDDVDLVFIGCFTEAAQLAYAVSHKFRQAGAVTVLGGPHARCYPDDARKYFDYVLGFTDKTVIRDVLADCTSYRPLGVTLAAAAQPVHLPGVRERWKFLEPTLAKGRVIRIVPMLSSLGCPYTCSFCIDSVVPYQPLDFEGIQGDLRFLREKYKQPLVGWHDPNFGIRFDEILGAIEEAVPPDSVYFAAESSLSLLKEENVKRLRKAGFVAMLPGIESWFDHGGKSKTRALSGLEKVEHVSEHIAMLMSYIPYVQTNFVLGFDDDEGAEPFELTKRFLDMTPAAFPGYTMLSSFGRAAPLNLRYEREGRVLPFPFHFLNGNLAMNIRPKQYSWEEFYDRVIDLTKYSFSWRSVGRRFLAMRHLIPRFINVMRAMSADGTGRIRYYSEVRRRLDTDPEVKAFFAQETTKLPEFYVDQVRRELGPFWDWLPEGALEYDPNAYLHSTTERTAAVAPVPVAPRPGARVPEPSD